MTEIPRAWSVQTPRLRLSAYDPRDADDFVHAVRRSLPSLRAFMPFAAEDPDPRLYTDFFVGFRRKFSEGDCTFAFRARDDGRVVGGGGFHPHVGPLGLEVGYWIVASETGKGFATEAVAALCHLAFEQEKTDRVELRIQPDNPGSIRVAEKAGFTQEAVLRRRIPFPGQPPRDCVLYTLFADEWPASPGASIPVERFDASGRPIAVR
jgi:RimJ/RimL family protein N-acetyltransferase